MSKPRDGASPYRVGYSRPPDHTKYRKGQSGNPSGRRKGQPSVADLMLREAARVVKVKSGDTVEKITKHEVVIRQLWKTAMQGDMAAMRLLLTFMVAAPVHADDSSLQDEDSLLSLPAKPDDDALRRMLASFPHLQGGEGGPREQ